MPVAPVLIVSQGRIPAPANGGQDFPQTNLPATPQQAYRAASAARNELLNQLSTVNGVRKDLATQINTGSLKGADLAGVEKRITVLDDQIVALDKQLAVARAEVARTAGVPGATEQQNPFNFISNRDKEYALSALFMVVVLLPISMGIARRLWRRGSTAVASLPREFSERLSRLEQSVESIAIEIERIGEGQRFMTNVLVDNVAERAIGPGAMEAIPVKPRERAEQPLRE